MNKENETKRGHELGCPHCAEMPYVFGRVDTGERDPFFPYHWVGADYDFMELIQDYWYHFAKNGDPNSEGRPVWKSMRMILTPAFSAMRPICCQKKNSPLTAMSLTR